MIGRQQLTDNESVKEIADKAGATTAQVLVAWGAYRGYSVIPKSVQESRIKSNFQQVELSKEDYQKISAIGKKDPIRWVCVLYSQCAGAEETTGSTRLLATSPSGQSTSSARNQRNRPTSMSTQEFRHDVPAN